ncbi:Meiotic nuclear division protein 1 [Rhizophlyctis rosea]|uniref:Meiotic nuclear division protein 1 n=1 Tax=Rhizophlyctis rosea TaxID=64517 RepID=A0AAD5X6M3_9FUNG|nr:Meiotic nuclear division protein 1 [Rhizophlyctis rosea]
MAPKMKGIVQQSVKEVLDSLVSDNLVTLEKIGTSNYYWSFPSTAMQSRKRKLEDLENELTKLKERRTELEEGIERAQEGREESDDRVEMLQRLQEAEALKKSQLKELDQFRDCDPALLEAKEKATIIAKDAANRWTDNIFALQSYCNRKFNISAQDFNRQFGISDDFDSIP